MTDLNLQSVARIDSISRDDFQNTFVKSNTPVVMRSFSENWAAKDKWTYDYFKQHCGDVEVPLYSEAMATSDDNYLTAQDKMRFGDYLDLIQQGPSKKRMFLFNIFEHMPQLCDDFSYPDLSKRFLNKYPFMFFGGETSYVDVHYDLDLSHVFLTQFTGKKKIILFAPEYSQHLYQHPLTVSCNVDFRDPDFERYPLLNHVKGYECTLEHGDTLFIPTGYWHYVYYETSGFSLSLRSRPERLSRRLYSWLKIFNLTVADRTIAKILGAQKWYDKKEVMAQKTAIKILLRESR
tara:strand:- start:30669 stop:31544 length:876 start_codon:yes stop_codon:yes gene_type:complete